MGPEQFDLIITGGSGFLWKYVVLPHLDPGLRFAYVGKRRPDDSTPFYECDLSSSSKEIIGKTENILSHVRAKVFLHLASPTPKQGVFDQQSADEMLRMARNVSSLASVVEAERLLHASSGAVYGSSWEGYARETDPRLPQDLYGRSKAAAEAIFDQGSWSKIVTHLRFFFPLSTTEMAIRALNEGHRSRLLPRMIHQLKQGEQIELLEDEFRFNPATGSSIALLLQAFVSNPGNSGKRVKDWPSALNVAGKEEISLSVFIDLLGKKLGISPKIIRSASFKPGRRSMLASPDALLSLLPDASLPSLFEYLAK